MIRFETQILADNDPIRFTLGWQGDSADGWALLDQPLVIQFRRRNRFDSPVLADADIEIADSEVFGTNGALIITLKDYDEPLPEFELHYDILQANGIRFGYGSVEVIRGVSE